MKTDNKMRWWAPFLFALALGAVAGIGGAYLWQSGAHEGNSPAVPADTLPRFGTAEQPAGPVPQRPVSAAENLSRTRQNAITRAAATVGPAVVAVTITQTRVVRSNPFTNDFWSRFFVPRFRREQVQSMGSGIVIAPEGYVITNDHVIQDADSIQVTLPDGATYAARLVGTDRESDLALLKVDGAILPAARLGDSDSLMIGEWAIALGNPFGHLLGDPQPTVTVGVVSAINRDVKRSPDDDRVYRKVIQTDAAINPGNSGGPLVNADGEVIGINSFIFSSSRGSEGIGFAIPVNQAKVIANDLIRYGEVRLAWVGVGIQPLPATPESPGFARSRGVIVSTVQPGSPADKAGLQVNDIIQVAAKRIVANVADWDGIASFWRPGDTVALEFMRDDDVKTARLTLRSRPLDDAEGEQVGYGLWISDIDPLLASQLSLDNSDGAVITRIAPNSQAAIRGFERGDIVRHINNRKVRSSDEFVSTLRATPVGGRAIVGVERDHKLYFTALDIR